MDGVVSPFLWKLNRRILSVPQNRPLDEGLTEEEYAYEQAV